MGVGGACGGRKKGRRGQIPSPTSAIGEQVILLSPWPPLSCQSSAITYHGGHHLGFVFDRLLGRVIFLGSRLFVCLSTRLCFFVGSAITALSKRYIKELGQTTNSFLYLRDRLLVSSSI